MTCIGKTLSELPLELEPEKDIASVAIISLPWPHDEKSIPKTKGFVSQAIPLFNPDSPPPLFPPPPFATTMTLLMDSSFGPDSTFFMCPNQSGGMIGWLNVGRNGRSRLERGIREE